ncbi:MAG: redoxin domain-containing protein [Gemmatimonadetes bacterium]|jgi:glutaredoxin-dependent peroxiredoxin|nr:redoxin domain-containing protein [Gemmatimonadota bacterium]
MLKSGAQAPDFSLAPGPGPDRVRLSDFRGSPVVIMFVPLAFSGTCTAEFCHIAENWAVWGDLNAEILGISIDSPFVNAKWREEMGVPFPILSDFNRDASRAYGVLYDEFYGLKGVAKRSAFVIDAAGLVVYGWVSDDADVMPPYDEIIQAVATG